MKKKILILAGYYFPSVKAGGPVQSIKNMVDYLGNTFEFYILALDRDLGDAKAFDNIEVNEWQKVGNANVFYTEYEKISIKLVSQIIKRENIDILYLNSVFDVRLSIIPLLLFKLNQINIDRIIVAPRGNFSKGALDLKKDKKKLFLNFAKKLNLFNKVTWHATAESEKIDIQEYLGNEANIVISNNLTANYKDIVYNKNIFKETGKLKLIFLSRIHPKKNLAYALSLLRHIEGEIEFNIWGPIEDKKYWLQCNTIIQGLPKNVQVMYKGIVGHDEVIECFKQNHFLLFPTLGENFGHIISESLIGGSPVIISDQTPWRELKPGIGWDISLENTGKFVEVLQYCMDLNNEDYQKMSRKSFSYGMKKANNEKKFGDYKQLFG